VADVVPPGTIWVDVSSDDEAYWRALCDIWATGEDFAIVEHDVVIHADAILSFDFCTGPWCTYGYDNICHPHCQEAWANMLGCTRFRAEVMAACPLALSSIPEGQRNWHNLCDHMAGNKLHGVDQPSLRPDSIRAGGFSHHWHTPPVHHISWEGHPR
jgi:hypothetical protein